MLCHRLPVVTKEQRIHWQEKKMLEKNLSASFKVLNSLLKFSWLQTAPLQTFPNFFIAQLMQSKNSCYATNVLLTEQHVLESIILWPMNETLGLRLNFNIKIISDIHGKIFKNRKINI